MFSPPFRLRFPGGPCSRTKIGLVRFRQKSCPAAGALHGRTASSPPGSCPPHRTPAPRRSADPSVRSERQSTPRRESGSEGCFLPSPRSRGRSLPNRTSCSTFPDGAPLPPHRRCTAPRSAVTGRVSRVVPVVSWVSVTRPSRRPATYSFCPLSANATPRVACPTKTGSTPVAMGSRVPLWPSFRVPSTPRILATTSKLVQPAGLSTIRIPCIRLPPGHPAPPGLRSRRRS